MDENKCNYKYNVSVHSSVKIGGATVGRCDKEPLPGMYYCEWHATRDAMGMQIRDLYAIVMKLKEHITNQPQLCHKDGIYECYCYNTQALPFCSNFESPDGPPYAYHCDLKKDHTWETCPHGKLWGGKYEQDK